MKPVLSLLTAALLLAGCVTDETYDYSPDSKHSFDDGQQLEADRAPNAKTLHALARILANQRRDKEALFALTRLIRQYPEYLPAYSELSEIQVRGGRLDDAVRSLSMGLHIAPEDAVLLNNLGMAWMLKSDYEKAYESFKEAAASAPENARYRANMATALGMLGRYDEALALYEQVVKPAYAHHNLAVVCEARDDHVRASLEYQRAEQLARKPRRRHGARR